MGASLNRMADTVAAIATAAGPSAIGCVRISGPDAVTFAARVLDGSPGEQPARRMVRTAVRDGTGRIVDEALSVVYLGPASYTGEDLVEIFCHGGSYNLRKVFETLVAAGCRPADPGEFTRRAFLNGKMDLSSAEAVNEIVHAENERDHRAAQDQLRGGLSGYLSGLEGRLADILAWFEAHLEHPEEDLDSGTPDQFLKDIATALEEARGHRKGLEADLLLRNGIRVVLAGRTNAGKSSLFNRLMGQERVLVSREHGTTRDAVSERILIGGVAVTLFDTAGFRDGADGIDEEAVKASERAIQAADTVIFVMDGSSPAREEDHVLFDLLGKSGKRFITAVNKIDLPGRFPSGPFAGNAGLAEISAKEGTNMEALTGLIAKELSLPGEGTGRSFCSTERTAGLFRTLEESFGKILDKLKSGEAYDRIILDLRSALGAFDEALGRSGGPDLLDRIFSRFCVGK